MDEQGKSVQLHNRPLQQLCFTLNKSLMLGNSKPLFGIDSNVAKVGDSLYAGVSANNGSNDTLVSP